MPVNYSIPPWLEPQGGTPAESYAKGFALGEQRRQANQRAALEQQQMQIQAATQAQAQAQRAAQAQAELAVEVKKQEEAASVAQEELAIKKQVQAQRDSQAAMRTAGIISLQNDISSGMPTENAIAKNFGAFANDSADMAGALHLIRSLTPPPAFTPSTTTVKHPITGEDIPVFQGGKGSAQMIRDQAAPVVKLSEVDRAKVQGAVSDLRRAKTELSKLQSGTEFMTPGSKSLLSIQKDIEAKKQEIADYQKELDYFGGGTANPIPSVNPATGAQEPFSPSPAGSKSVQRMRLANQLIKDHPDWTKEQVIAEAKNQIP